MTAEKPKRVTSPSEFRPIYAEVKRRLQDSPWFPDGWTVVVGDRDDITWLGLNKLSWQTSGLEIHFESWIKKEQIAKRRVPLAMHVEGGHHTRRYAFNSSFHSAVADQAQTLGVQARPKLPGEQIGKLEIQSPVSAIEPDTDIV